MLLPASVVSGPKNWFDRPKLAPCVTIASVPTSGSRSAARAGVPSFRTRTTLRNCVPCGPGTGTAPSGTWTTGGSNVRVTPVSPERTNFPTRHASCASGGRSAKGSSTMAKMSSSVTGWNRSSQ